jgi:putative hydrolase of the HAD superfamily
MSIRWNSIDAVILDLGGVILNIDYTRTIEAFQSLGFESFDTQYSQLQQSGLFDQLEKGLISEHAFIAAVQERIPQANAPQIIDAWNALLLDFPAGRIETVQQIASQWPTFLLSNTNAIHYRAFNKTLKEQTGISDIKPVFKKAYLSHEIGMRKPDGEAFQLILDEQGLDPRNVLFVDDSPQHVEAARSLGLQAHHLVDPERLEDLFGPFLA